VAEENRRAVNGGAPPCAQGFVWREAFRGDYVCVTPESRSQAARENSDPAGAEPCRPGTVWREAGRSDHVCVPVARRSAVAEENRRAVNGGAPPPAPPPAGPRSRPAPNPDTGNLSNDVEGWNQYGFSLGVHRSDSLSDLIFTWQCRPPSHYDAFNVRVRISDGREGQVELAGGNHGSYRERNAEEGKTYTFLIQGCDKGTFGSKCTQWSQLPVLNDRNLR
jgi:hypothetical protein